MMNIENKLAGLLKEVAGKHRHGKMACYTPNGKGLTCLEYLSTFEDKDFAKTAHVLSANFKMGITSVIFDGGDKFSICMYESKILSFLTRGKKRFIYKCAHFGDIKTVGGKETIELFNTFSSISNKKFMEKFCSALENRLTMTELPTPKYADIA